MRFSIIVLAFAATVNGLVRSAKPQFPSSSTIVKGPWTVGESGITYQNKRSFNFATLPNNAELPMGLVKSGYPVGKTHAYDVKNVNILGGYLELKVPGNQTSKPYKSAEVVTAVQNIKSASVRTVAIFAEAPGVCNGIFFYKNDNQETDIEWLSDVNTVSNTGRGQTRKIWLANQDADGDGQKSWTAVAAPADPTNTEHEYRIDWTAGNGTAQNPGEVKFYIDAVLQWSTTKDVPSVPGPWVFNNWANGDKGWSCGPPKTDALFRIKDIDMYFNTV